MAQKRTKNITGKDKLLPKLTIFFFNRPRFTALVWLAITIFGLFSYTTLLRREGFPSVNIPIAVVGGTYFVNDPQKVNANVAEPISAIALEQPGVSTVQTQSGGNFFTVTVQYDEGVDSKQATASLEKAVADSGKVPPQAQVTYNVPYFGITGGDVQQIDMAISFFDPNNQTSTQDLTAKAEAAAAWLKAKNLSYVKDVTIKNPYATVPNPATGQAVTVQRTFDRFGHRHDDDTQYYSSVLITVAGVEDFDVIKLDQQVTEAVNELNNNPEFAGFEAEVSGSYAPEIKENIGELQRVLIEGLLAVLVVGSIVIAIRASLITVISMVTVLLATLGLLYALGYTLNVITLFALILSLALIVDDTIIMVEAIDAARHHHKDKEKAVREATRKVSRAMVAATLTAALSFVPLIFVGGILGSFIRAIPVTIIAALLISLLVALIFIPYFARFLLLGKKQMGKKGVVEVASGFEASVANFIAKPMIWARNSRKRLFAVGSAAVVIGMTFIISGILIGRNVVFNIFPPSKDSNGIMITLVFPAGTQINQAEQIAAEADQLAAGVIGSNYEQGSYYATGSSEGGTQQISIIPYNKRDVKAPELALQLQQKFDQEFTKAVAKVSPIDVGPPGAQFTVEIKADNREAALLLANDMAKYLNDLELKRTNGTTAGLVNVTASTADQFISSNGQQIVTVTGSFDATDTSTLVTLAQNAVENEFNAERLNLYGMSDDVISFNLGQESENQESFRALVIAFPLLLVVMYLLLAIQFRSLLQPLLIFLAIPFSIFGIMLGLDITNNAISFFAMLGFFALVGLSIKNTILLTDFANQARQEGLSVVDSAVAALRERFRPLFATSMTAVVSLIPLAIASPFWEGLAVVLIFGLLSSTLLVVTVFPYYYLGAEFLRLSISRKNFLLWLVATGALAVAAGRLINPAVGPLVVLLSLVLVGLKVFYQRLLAR